MKNKVTPELIEQAIRDAVDKKVKSGMTLQAAAKVVIDAANAAADKAVAQNFTNSEQAEAYLIEAIQKA